MRSSIGWLRDMVRESPDFLALAVVCVLLGMGPNPRVARTVSSVPLHMFPGCDRNPVDRVRTTDRWVRFIGAEEPGVTLDDLRDIRCGLRF